MKTEQDFKGNLTPISYGFKTTTDEIQAYIQAQLDTIVATIRTKGYKCNDKGEIRQYDGPNIRVNVRSAKLDPQSIVTPLVLDMPEEVCIRRRKDTGIAAIVFPKAGQDVNILPPFANFIEKYRYRESDISQTFQNPKWCKDVNISSTVADHVMRTVKPKLLSVKNKPPRVVVFIDPIKVLHDMGYDRLGKKDQPYVVEIDNVDSLGKERVRYYWSVSLEDNSRRDRKNGGGNNQTITGMLLGNSSRRRRNNDNN